jgi:bacillithiol system protein YtxJ
MTPWKNLSKLAQLDVIAARSAQVPVAIFKHSTRCPLSSLAKARLEEAWHFRESDLEIYYLDLIAHRDISNGIAERFAVHHESPQLLLIRNGQCVYDESHLDIHTEHLAEALRESADSPFGI